MEIYYTGVGTIIASVLWVFSGIWEWSVPKIIERKVNNLMKDTNYKNASFQLKGEKNFYEHEQFAYYIKNILPRLERDLGHLVHVEVQIDGNGGSFSNEEKRYFSCLSRLFTEYSWTMKESLDCKADQ